MFNFGDILIKIKYKMENEKIKLLEREISDIKSMDEFKFKNLTGIIKPKNGGQTEYLNVQGFGTGYNYLPEEAIQFCADGNWEIYYCNAEKHTQGFIIQARRSVNNLIQ